MTGTPEEALYVARTICFEQQAGIRRPGPLQTLKQGTKRQELNRVIRAILIRRDLFVHLKFMFPKMLPYLQHYGSDKFYEINFDIKPDFTMTEESRKKLEVQRLAEGDADNVNGPDDLLVAAESSCPSTYTCHGPLIGLCERLARGSLDWPLCCIAEKSTPGKALELAETAISKTIDEIAILYAADFPVKPAANPQYKVEHLDNLDVINTRVVESDNDYRVQLAVFNERALQHENKAASDFINSRIVVIADEMRPGTSTLVEQLAKLPLLGERGRKRLVTYNVTIDAPVDWNMIKKRRKNMFNAAGPGLCVARLQTIAEEVFTIGHAQNPENEDTDVLVTLLRQDLQKPINVLDLAKDTMKTATKRHIQAVGSIEPESSGMLQLFKRRAKAFGARVEDRLVASSRKGLEDCVSGKMKYLNADTYFNRWPIPVLPLASMAQLSEDLNTKLFAGANLDARTPDDDGEDDELNLAADMPEGMVAPFPLEPHPVLTQEMMHVFKADVLVDASPASGQSMLAVLQSNLRGVAIARNPVHQKFIMSNIQEWVKVCPKPLPYQLPLHPNKPIALLPPTKHKTFQARKLAPNFMPLEKPAALSKYEIQTKGFGGAAPVNLPTPAHAKVPLPAAPGQPPKPAAASGLADPHRVNPAAAPPGFSGFGQIRL